MKPRQRASPLATPLENSRDRAARADCCPMALAFFLVLTLFLGSEPIMAAAAGSPPNILFIMSGDHAAQAISAYGGRLNRTPNLDRLASQGLRLDCCFAVNSICTPSRATILTGQY